MIQQFAPRHTLVPAGSGGTTTTIANGEPILVWGIAVAGSASAAVITITDNSNNTILVINTAANGSTIMPIPFVANNGLKVVQTTNTSTITVYHSSTSA